MEGKDIVVPIDDGKNIIGFFATRVVRASSSEQAIDKAQAMVIKDWTAGSYAESNKGSPPALTVRNIWPESFLSALLFKNTGHIFYPDVEDEA